MSKKCATASRPSCGQTDTRVNAARNTGHAAEIARREPPDLILVSVGGSDASAVEAGRQMPEQGGLNDEIPIVIISSDPIEEGAELETGTNIFITRPDSFERVGSLLGRLIQEQRGF